MPASNEPSGDTIYQLKVTLSDTDPPIWRRLLVSSDTTLATLHRILQVAMGWEDYHLHQFSFDGLGYGPPGKGLGLRNEKNVKLSQAAPKAGARFAYQYDFGDSWDHIVLVEKILPPEAGVAYPVCQTGKGACPPEDVGGVWGYYAFLEAVQDPNHPEHDDMVEWVGDEFDPEEFNMDEVNRALKKIR
jgi:Plasmid pRiA4b ORF-3-like protein